jgi:hypothetical protein
MKEELEKLYGFVPFAYLSILRVHWNNLCCLSWVFEF